MCEAVPPWARELDWNPMTIYTVHLDGERYTCTKPDVAQTLSEAGALITAVTGGSR